MLLHCCSTQGQLRLTCTFSAECAQAEGCGGVATGATAWQGSKGSEGSNLDSRITKLCRHYETGEKLHQI